MERIDNKFLNEQITPANSLLFQQKRMMTSLFKMFLFELEEMLNEHLISDEYFRQQRKAILDAANSHMREFEDYLGKFNIKFKQ